MKDSNIPWIGDIPKHWLVDKVKFHLKTNEYKGYPDATVLSLYRDLGVVPKESRDDNHNVTSEDTSKYKHVEVGDFVINKMKAWQGSVAISNYEGIVSPAYYVYRFYSESFNKKYFHYLLRDKSYTPEFRRLSGGIREGQWDLSREAFRNIPILIPPIEEQQAIADYLDKKIGEIDSAIKEANDLIDKYKSYKQSIITKAVTKGIIPNVSMKDSGLPWIGEIPEHWGLTRIETLFSEGLQKNILYEFDHALKFTYGNLVPKNEEGDVSELKGTYLAYSIIDENDIAINGLNLNFDFVSQRVARCPQRGILTSAYLILKPNDVRYSRYYTYQLKSWDNQKVFHGMGKGVRLTLSFPEVKKMLMPIPPLSEQQAIADYLDDKCAQIDSIIESKNNLIKQLQEYKKSIIFEYVTGKKEVPNG